MKKIIDKKIMLTFLVLLVLIITFFLFSLSIQKQQTRIPIAIPTPIQTEAGTPMEEKFKPLTILSSSIPIDRALGTQEGFVIEFSKTPSPSEFYYSLKPETKVNLTLRGTDIRIVPSPSWNPNTQYELVVEGKTKDVYGNFLDRKHIFKFKTLYERGM